MAEVLITLGIIGIAAALTFPSIVQNYQKKVVETRLKKFYSVMNEAVKFAEINYGDKQNWYVDTTSYDEQYEWFMKYLAPYIKYTKIEKAPLRVYFADGSMLRTYGVNTRDYTFFPGGSYKKCSKQPITYGVCAFAFNFHPIKPGGTYWKYHTNMGFEPYKAGWDGTIKRLKEGSDGTSGGCSENSANKDPAYYCTALIQLNNWKIPDDYPFKVSY